VSFPKNVWNQLKGITCQELIAALEKDGWSMDQGQGSIQIYRHPEAVRLYRQDGKPLPPATVDRDLAKTISDVA